MNTVIRPASHILSIIMHPMFMITYVLLILFKYNPYLFGLAHEKGQSLFLITVVMLTVFFPLVAIVMMKALNMIESVQMKTRQERIGPLIVTGIFYIWLYLNIKDNSGIPEIFSSFVLGSTIALFIAFFINNFSKVSLHAVGMGGFVMGLFFIRQYFAYGFASFDFIGVGDYMIHINILFYLSIFLSGLVASSRLILGAHLASDLSGGFLIGLFAQLLAFRIFF